MPRYLNRPESGMETLGQMVGVLRGLQGLQAGEEEQQVRGLEVMKLMRELEGPSPREKFRYEMLKDERARRDEQTKYMLNTFKDLHEKGSPASRTLLTEMMKNLYYGLTPQEQASVSMIANHTPLNPMAQKAEWFDQVNPPVRITAKYSEDPYLFAQQVFAAKERDEYRQHVMTGVKPEGARVLGMPDDRFALKGPDGKVKGIFSSGDLKLEDKATLFGTTAGEVLLNNGYVFGKERVINQGGALVKIRPKLDLFAQGAKIDYDMIPEAGALAAEAESNKELRDLGAAWAIDNRDDKSRGGTIYRAMAEMRDKGLSNDAVVAYLQQMYPGTWFAIEDVGKARGVLSYLPGVDHYAEGETERLIWWTGVPRTVNTADGQPIVVFEDRNGIVRDRGGTPRATSIEEFVAAVGSKTAAQVREAAGTPQPKPSLPARPRKAEPGMYSEEDLKRMEAVYPASGRGTEPAAKLFRKLQQFMQPGAEELQRLKDLEAKRRESMEKGKK